ncbi:hypothetical protein LG290_12975 [Halomonas sediminis]
MTDQSIRVDLADGSSWYFSSETTAVERGMLMLSHIQAIIEDTRLNTDKDRPMPHALRQKLIVEMDFAMGLMEEAA